MENISWPAVKAFLLTRAQKRLIPICMLKGKLPLSLFYRTNEVLESGRAWHSFLSEERKEEFRLVSGETVPPSSSNPRDLTYHFRHAGIFGQIRSTCIESQRGHI